MFYETSTQSGVTGSSGEFRYLAGEIVTFRIGDIILGSAEGFDILTPVDLVSGGDTSNTTVVNICRLLQSLDSDLSDSAISLNLDLSSNASYDSIGHLIDQLDFSDNVTFPSVAAEIISSIVTGVDGYSTVPSLVESGYAQAHLEHSLGIAVVNHVPVSDAGIDQTVNVGEIIFLNGSGSNDVDGDILTYQWSVASKPEGSSALLVDESAGSPILVVDVEGTYEIQLVVNDGIENSAPDTISCTVLNYNTAPVPVSTAAATSRLLPAVTLKSWVDAGFVNSGGFSNVVILHVNSSRTAYDSGHIPGALFLDISGLYQTRVEGPMTQEYMVAPGHQLDNILQSLGITETTAIVLTGTNTTEPARTYFTLRYWGFPRTSLYMLDGLDPAWAEAYPNALETLTPSVVPSTFSVRDNGMLNDDLRASLGEMIVVAEAEAEGDAVSVDLQNGNPGTIILDNRDVIQLAPTNFAYNGRWNGAVQMGTAPGEGIVGSSGNGWGDEASDIVTVAEELQTYFESLGVTSDMRTYVQSTTGSTASNAFFVLDGILGWEVVLYDGSWGQMRDLAPLDKGGALPEGSVWAPEVGAETDRMSLFAWGYDLQTDPEWKSTFEPLVDAVTLASIFSASDPRGNQIENEDAAYMLDDSGADSLAAGGDAGC